MDAKLATRKRIVEELRPVMATRSLAGTSPSSPSSYEAHDATKKAMCSGSADDHIAAAQAHEGAAQGLEDAAAGHRKAAEQHYQMATPDLASDVTTD